MYVFCVFLAIKIRLPKYIKNPAVFYFKYFYLTWVQETTRFFNVFFMRFLLLHVLCKFVVDDNSMLLNKLCDLYFIPSFKHLFVVDKRLSVFSEI